MHGIVRADDEVGSRGDKDVAGSAEELRDCWPVGLDQKTAVFSEAEGVQDDFRMVMGTKDLAAFSGDGFVAKRCSRSAAGCDTYGFQVLPGMHNEEIIPDVASHPIDFQELGEAEKVDALPVAKDWEGASPYLDAGVYSDYLKRGKDSGELYFEGGIFVKSRKPFPGYPLADRNPVVFPVVLPGNLDKTFAFFA